MIRYFAPVIFMWCLSSCVAGKNYGTSQPDKDIIIMETGTNTKGDNRSSSVHVLVKDKDSHKPSGGYAICINDVCFVSLDTSGMSWLFIHQQKITFTIKSVGYQTKIIKDISLDLSKDYSITVFLTEMKEPLY